MSYMKYIKNYSFDELISEPERNKYYCFPLALIFNFNPILIRL